MYPQLFPRNWASDESTEHRHMEIYSRMGQWPLREAPDGTAEVDPVLVVLFSGVLVRSTHGLALEDEDAASEAQAKRLAMLMKYLRLSAGSGARRKLMEAVVLVQEAGEAAELAERGRRKM